MMGASSGSNNQNQPPPNMLPPRQANSLQPFLFVTSSDTFASSSDQVRENPTESASSREPWPAADNKTIKKEIDFTQQPAIRSFSDSNKVSLQDIARERVDLINEKMCLLPDDYLEELKTKLRSILEGSGGSHYREELFLLQKLVQTRSDLNATSLVKAHRAQLEILVAINSGIQAFLHPNVNLSQSALIDVFVYKRCRNIACQNVLPAEQCSCEICSSKKGFCHLCMCVICTKFDFEINTCRWIGCDSCSHWTHTDCAIRDKQICVAPFVKGGVSLSEMVFRCRACNHRSELLGWVKDVFEHCAPSWNRESLLRELDFVSRIFRGSENTSGRKLFWKCEELIDKLKSGVAEATACRVILTFFQELDLDSPKNNQEFGENGAQVAPQDACNKISEVVQEAIRRMEMVANEKMKILKRARLDLEICDQELEHKAREVAELKREHHEKKQQIEELESIVRLKQAEADMFQIKANEARREADRLQSIALSKSKKSEEEYAAKYLKLRLSEAEAERQYLFEKMKLQETSSSSIGGDPSQAMVYSKIQDLLKNVYAEGKPDKHLTSTKTNP